MKFKVLQDLLLNVFLPLTLGAIIYLTGKSFIDNTFFKNHVADACWAYAFGSVLLIIWDRNIPVHNEKQVEEKSIEGNYILMEDGSRIHGKKVTWKSGILAKDQVKIDDEKFPMRDVKGYMANNIFYIKKGNEFIKRIVHGKINIYVQFT